jgi:hypothetical protein
LRISFIFRRASCSGVSAVACGDTRATGTSPPSPSSPRSPGVVAPLFTLRSALFAASRAASKRASPLLRMKASRKMAEPRKWARTWAVPRQRGQRPRWDMMASTREEDESLDDRSDTKRSASARTGASARAAGSRLLGAAGRRMKQARETRASMMPSCTHPDRPRTCCLTASTTVPMAVATAVGSDECDRMRASRRSRAGRRMDERRGDW